MSKPVADAPPVLHALVALVARRALVAPDALGAQHAQVVRVVRAAQGALDARGAQDAHIQHDLKQIIRSRWLPWTN